MYAELQRLRRLCNWSKRTSADVADDHAAGTQPGGKHARRPILLRVVAPAYDLLVRLLERTAAPISKTNRPDGPGGAA